MVKKSRVKYGFHFSFCARVTTFTVPALYLTFEMPLLGTVCILLVIFYGLCCQ